MFAQAAQAYASGDARGAVRLYKRGLAIDDGNPTALNNLGAAFLALGEYREASERFRQAILLQPPVLDDFAAIVAVLTQVCPPVVEAAATAEEAWPRRLSETELFGSSGVAAIADDPLTLCILQTTTVRSIGFERLLTTLRQHLLNAAGATDATAVTFDHQAFWCALAQQCFINEYVFVVTSEEEGHLDALTSRLTEATAQGNNVPPIWLVAAACYAPLDRLSGTANLAGRKWPDVVRAVIRQQIEEPAQERTNKSAIRKLTGIDDDISLRVQAQYEESPYPRWVLADPQLQAQAIDDHLRATYPHAMFRPLGDREPLDILVAGCGTGRHVLGLARTYRHPRILAVDLSATSLAYAIRKTPDDLRGVIDYAQADILKLPDTGRAFDLIETRGVLHHMRDPFEGWRALLPLLKAGGIMNVGLYSELARQDIVAARNFIAEQGFSSTPDGIRRCRQAMLDHPQFK
ncbi:MAG: methyltransferase domain-containing protein, partial [Pseudolabrys sp.]